MGTWRGLYNSVLLEARVTSLPQNTSHAVTISVCKCHVILTQRRVSIAAMDYTYDSLLSLLSVV